MRVPLPAASITQLSGNIRFLLLSKDPRDDHAHLEEGVHGYGHEELARHFRRRNDGAQDHDGEDGVPSFLCEEAVVDDARFRKIVSDEGHLEYETEDDEHLQGEVHVLFEGGHGDDAGPRVTDEEVVDRGHDHEIAEKPADYEKNAAEA